MKIQISLSFEFTGGKKGKSRKSTNSGSEEIPEILEFSGSTTEVRAQPSYIGFALPTIEEET